MKLLLKDAGFETEKTAAYFDEKTWSVLVCFKKDAHYHGWEIAEYIRKNGLFAAELIAQNQYSEFTTYLQIHLPLSVMREDWQQLDCEPYRR